VYVTKNRCRDTRVKLKAREKLSPTRNRHSSAKTMVTFWPACVCLRPKRIIVCNLRECVAWEHICRKLRIKCRAHRVIDVNLIRRGIASWTAPLDDRRVPTARCIIDGRLEYGDKKVAKKLMSLGRPRDFTLLHLLYIHARAVCWVRGSSQAVVRAGAVTADVWLWTTYTPGHTPLRVAVSFVRPLSSCGLIVH